MNTRNPNDRGYRYPAETISQVTWPYHCFCLISRDVEDPMAGLGVVAFCETVRQVPSNLVFKRNS
jgi:transposase-like protein